jgi:hypothetical protein
VRHVRVLPRDPVRPRIGFLSLRTVLHRSEFPEVPATAGSRVRRLSAGRHLNRGGGNTAFSRCAPGNLRCFHGHRAFAVKPTPNRRFSTSPGAVANPLVKSPLPGKRGQTALSTMRPFGVWTSCERDRVFSPPFSEDLQFHGRARAASQDLRGRRLIRDDLQII